MHASIIIVNWNTPDLLVACLESIYRHPPRESFDVWVVDNASSDDSAQRVREHFPQVNLIENAQNVGFATANNQAIRSAEGQYMILLNPDTVVEPEALQGLLAYMDQQPEVGGAGPYLLNPDGSLQPSCTPLPTLGRELWRLFHLDRLRPYGVYAMEAWDPAEPRPVGVIQGACMALRKRALDQIGLLDETYFMYTEEVDLCLRLQRGGWDVHWFPQARVVHYGGQSTRLVAVEMFLHLNESKLLYFRKNHGPLAARLYKGILLAASLARLTFLPLASLLHPAEREEHRSLSHKYQLLVQALPGM